MRQVDSEFKTDSALRVAAVQICSFLWHGGHSTGWYLVLGRLQTLRSIDPSPLQRRGEGAQRPQRGRWAGEAFGRTAA